MQMTQKETDNLNTPITSKEVELLKKLTTKKSSRDFTTELYQAFKELIPHKIFKKKVGKNTSQIIMWPVLL